MNCSSQCHVKTEHETDETAKEQNCRSTEIDPQSVQFTLVFTEEYRVPSSQLLGIKSLFTFPDDGRIRLPNTMMSREFIDLP